MAVPGRISVGKPGGFRKLADADLTRIQEIRSALDVDRAPCQVVGNRRPGGCRIVGAQRMEHLVVLFDCRSKLAFMVPLEFRPGAAFPGFLGYGNTGIPRNPLQRKGSEMVRARFIREQDHRASGFLERPLQCADEVLDIFQSDRQPNEAVNDADALALRFIDIRMGHRYRVRDQRFNRAEVLCECP